MEIVHKATFRQHNMVVLHGDAVWLTFAAPWYYLLEWLRWALMPGKRAWLQLTVTETRQKPYTAVSVEKLKVRVRAVRLAKTHVRMPVLEA